MLALLCFSCSNPSNHESNTGATETPEANNTNMAQADLKNDTIRNYEFLKGMRSDTYFPEFLVDKIETVLVALCADIESKSPADLDELYVLTHAATEKINELQTEFEQNGSEIETAAREDIAEDFAFIAETYGFDADIEELIAPRDW